MRRRALLIAAVGSVVSVVPIAARAQATKAPIVIGWLDAGSPETSGQYLTTFREAMSALGRRAGVDVAFELRWAQGKSERLRSLAAELAEGKPAVIVVSPRIATVAVVGGFRAVNDLPATRPVADLPRLAVRSPGNDRLHF